MKNTSKESSKNCESTYCKKPCLKKGESKMPISSKLRSQIDGIKTAVEKLRKTADKESNARKEDKNPTGSPNDWNSCRDELLKFLGKPV